MFLNKMVIGDYPRFLNKVTIEGCPMDLIYKTKSFCFG